MSTPIDSPATRQSTGTPALDISTASATPQSGPTPALSTIPANQPPQIFASFTQSGESFHVFPHKGSVKLVASLRVSLESYTPNLPYRD